ncbi:uncharacterized protein G2W53_034245 [Senna tora]|uniref:Uncharacterized protein n=1 Tax=Senna tora TaxID=362788 RepID=A0A834TAQ6_9FABA|nr:uncharacterized protein G2W53_034245 [Senna tora]
MGVQMGVQCDVHHWNFACAHVVTQKQSSDNDA